MLRIILWGILSVHVRPPSRLRDSSTRKLRSTFLLSPFCQSRTKTKTGKSSKGRKKARNGCGVLSQSSGFTEASHLVPTRPPPQYPRGGEPCNSAPDNDHVALPRPVRSISFGGGGGCVLDDVLGRHPAHHPRYQGIGGPHRPALWFMVREGGGLEEEEGGRGRGAKATRGRGTMPRVQRRDTCQDGGGSFSGDPISG